MRRIITITSGKGGVGKSSICLNLALQLSRQGYSTCLFDADLGLANINILLGIHPELDIKDVILQDKEIRDIILRTNGIDILPGSSGIEEIANLNAEHLQTFITKLSCLDSYDYLLFDTSAGLSRNVISFCLASTEVVLVITPEPTSLTDAYALLKVLLANKYSGTIKVIVNQCKTPETAKNVYNTFKNAVTKYLDVEIKPLGPVYSDGKVSEAIKKQQPLAALFPDSLAARSISKIAERLIAGAPADHQDPDFMVSFWRRFLGIISGPLMLPRSKESNKENKPEINQPSTSGTDNQDKNSVTANTNDKCANLTPIQNQPPGAADVPGAQLPPGMLTMFELLTEGISTISYELHQVREAIEKLGESLNSGTAPQHHDSAEEHRPEVIRLDIDSFLAKYENNLKE